MGPVAANRRSFSENRSCRVQTNSRPGGGRRRYSSRRRGNLYAARARAEPRLLALALSCAAASPMDIGRGLWLDRRASQCVLYAYEILVRTRDPPAELPYYRIAFSAGSRYRVLVRLRIAARANCRPDRLSRNYSSRKGDGGNARGSRMEGRSPGPECFLVRQQRCMASLDMQRRHDRIRGPDHRWLARALVAANCRSPLLCSVSLGFHGGPAVHAIPMGRAPNRSRVPCYLCRHPVSRLALQTVALPADIRIGLRKAPEPRSELAQPARTAVPFHDAATAEPSRVLRVSIAGLDTRFTDIPHARD